MRKPEFESFNIQGYSTPDDALSYDLVYSLTETEDLRFWGNMANQLQPDRILEIGCGTGRVTWPMAMLGFNIVGLDSEQAMLDVARLKRRYKPSDVRRRARFIQKDARDFTFKQKFDLVIIPLNTFNHFVDTEDQVAVLKNIQSCLNPEKGVLIMDLLNAGATSVVCKDSSTQIIDNAIPSEDPSKLILGKDLEDKLGVARLIYDYYDKTTGVFYVHRWNFLVNLEKNRLAASHRIHAPMAVHTWISIMNPLKEAGFERGQNIGNYEAHPYLDIACLTVGVPIKGTPAQKMIVIAGPGWERVHPKPVGPEEAEKYSAFRNTELGSK